MSNTALHKREKLNQLLKNWVSGTVMVQPWLEGLGISRQLSHFYAKQGWIEKIGQGAFIKAGDQVDWLGGLYAIQHQLNLKVHLGGRSLLELIGSSHFVPMGQKRAVYIFADQKSAQNRLPKWFFDAFSTSIKLNYLPRELFSKPYGLELLEQPNFSIHVSSRERALMEILSLVPQTMSYEHAYLLFQGQETLRPDVVQKLLESCVSFKVKRLFMHLAKNCSLPWLKKINLKRVNLGESKIQIGIGGCYDSEYRISVPKLNSFNDEDREIEV